MKPKQSDSQFPTVRVYDNGGKTIDRYTAVFLEERNERNGFYACIVMSENPFHPQGFGQHSECQLGKHLGKQIDSKDLPEDCQKLIRQNV